MSNSRSEFCLGLAALLACTCCAHAATVDPRVRAQARMGGSVDVLLVLADQDKPVLPMPAAADYKQHRRALVDALHARAGHAQRALRAWLDARGVEHRDFWLANLIQARVPSVALAELAARGELARIDPNPVIALQTPQAGQTAAASIGVPWGVAKVEAPAVWAAGFTGQGVVIGGEDTGYTWDHPALKAHYRGWNGSVADHNHNWHDAVHDAAGNPCGNDSPVPCDDDILEGHGTHTAGTFAGDDGAGNQIGVAPGAKWIGCRNMDQGAGTPARYLECMQWMLAPTDLNGLNPAPDLAPDIVSNSWGCPTSEGCVTGNELAAAVNTLVDAGIFYVVAAGNYGAGCDTILDEPSVYSASFDVGATDSQDALTGFSSRGPVASDLQRIRPDLAAPGAGVYSSRGCPPGFSCPLYEVMSGTSMATPHVAGSAALLMSAFPALKGKPQEVASILRETAVTQGVTNTSTIVQNCGGTAITTWPNDMAGYGRVDAWNAYRDIISIDGFDD